MTIHSAVEKIFKNIGWFGGENGPVSVVLSPVVEHRVVSLSPQNEYGQTKS